MALTAKEKQKRYRERIKNNPTKYNIHLKKERARSSKYRIKVEELSDKEKLLQRKKWREHKRLQRKNESAENEETISSSLPLQVASISSSGNDNGNVKRGRRTILKNRSKTVRELKKIKQELLKKYEEIENLLRSKEKYRKRAARLNNVAMPLHSLGGANEQSSANWTPNSKARRQLFDAVDYQVTPEQAKKLQKSPVIRTLTLHNVMMDSLKQNYRMLRKFIGPILCSQLMKKYRLRKSASISLGLKQHKRIVEKVAIRQCKHTFLVKTFFQTDDVSRATAGIKDTVTFNKIKKQKRYLLSTMKKLYNKFKMTYPNIKLSYTTFCRNRPFFVVKPSVSDRDTCMCVKHTNVELLARKLKTLGVFENGNPHELTALIVCSKGNHKCMYNECKKCRSKVMPIYAQVDPNNQTTWEQWERVTEEIENKNAKGVVIKKKSMTVCRKVEKAGSIGEMITQFNEQMIAFKRHIYNIKKQNESFKLCKSTLDKYSVAVQVDFSENYSCKLASEIQGFHFGGARNQVTLHTGVLYAKDKEPQPFTSVSPCLDHKPPAIWAHLGPVLNWIKEEYPDLKIIHFFSDGPTSQYRQKANFYLLKKTMGSLGLNCTWSFFEAGHGKGAADGVGGALKRSANENVASGKDIPDAKTFYDLLSVTSKIKLFYISEEQVEEIRKSMPQNLMPVPGTFKIHQVSSHTYDDENILYRNLSCFCEQNIYTKNKHCQCFPYKIAKMTDKAVKKKKSYEWITQQFNDDSETDSSLPEVGGLISYHDDESDISISELLEEYEQNDDVILKPVDMLLLKSGTFILVEYLEGVRKKTKYRYAGVCINDFDNDDQDVQVRFMRVIGENGSLFRMEESDVSYVTIDQILGILPDPEIKIKETRRFYEFPASVDVNEKGGVQIESSTN